MYVHLVHGLLPQGQEQEDSGLWATGALSSADHQSIRASEHPAVHLVDVLHKYVHTGAFTIYYIPRTKECTKIFVLSTIFSASYETTEHRCIYFYTQVVREIYPRRRHFHKAGLFPAFRFIGVFGLNGLHHSSRIHLICRI